MDLKTNKQKRTIRKRVKELEDVVSTIKSAKKMFMNLEFYTLSLKAAIKELKEYKEENDVYIHKQRNPR